MASIEANSAPLLGLVGVIFVFTVAELLRSLFAGVRKFSGGKEVLFGGSFGFTGDVVTHATLLACHRRTDPERSLPQQPFPSAHRRRNR